VSFRKSQACINECGGDLCSCFAVTVVAQRTVALYQSMVSSALYPQWRERDCTPSFQSLLTRHFRLDLPVRFVGDGGFRCHILVICNWCAESHQYSLFYKAKFCGVPSQTTVKVACAVGKRRLRNTALYDDMSIHPTMDVECCHVCEGSSVKKIHVQVLSL
jgi:hypothetical protein